MTPTEAHAVAVAHLTTAVDEFRSARSCLAMQRGRPVTFAETADTLRGLHPQPAGLEALAELAEILDANSPEEVDADLTTRWRDAAHPSTNPTIKD